MSAQSILLSLDGSAQSRYAAEICWALAGSSGMTVDAQHVVDSLAAWDFLNFDIAGFIGSEPFFEAHESMLACLKTIGESLIEAYEGQAAGHSVKGQIYLDEGTTIREICWRAREHSMVVIGQRGTGMGSPEEDKRVLPRRSVAESLTYYCPRPLLVVQDRSEPWTKMKIILSSLSLPSSLLSSCFEFAEKLKIKAEIKLVLTAENHDDEVKLEDLETCSEAQKLMADLAKLVPAVAGVKTEVCRAKNISKFWKHEAEEDSSSLLVVPVTQMGGSRKTSLGEAPDSVFVI